LSVAHYEEIKHMYVMPFSDQSGLVDQPAEDELTHRAADAATDIHSGTNFMNGFPFTVRSLLLILVSSATVPDLPRPMLSIRIK
jgi:hypothetical protein